MVQLTDSAQLTRQKFRDKLQGKRIHVDTAKAELSEESPPLVAALDDADASGVADGYVAGPELGVLFKRLKDFDPHSPNPQALQLSGPGLPELALYRVANALEVAAVDDPNPPNTPTPRIDQHRLPHHRNWAFCGIACALMVRKHAGQDVPLNASTIASAMNAMYITGEGTSGAAMANYLATHDIPSRYTTGGTRAELLSALALNRPVPVGVDSFSGVVEAMDAPSARYPGLNVGQSYWHTFGASGHWVTVTGFEGSPSNPSHYIVNDPDTGASVRIPKSEFDHHSVPHSGLWMVLPD